MTPLLLLLLLPSRGVQAKTVQADSFQLVDKKGRVVARLEAVNDGAELLLLGPGGRLGARVTTAPGYPAVELYGADGRPRVVAQVAGGENPDVALFDETGYRFHLALPAKGQPLLELVGRDGKANQLMTFSKDSEEYKGGRPMFILTAPQQDDASVALGFASDGGGRMSVLTRDGQPKVTIGAPADDPTRAITIFSGKSDASGKAEVIWRAPGRRN